MKKKIMSIVLATAMVGTLAACGLSSPSTANTDSAADTNAAAETTAAASTDAAASDSAAAGDPTVTLTFAEVNPTDTVIGQVDTYFKEKVEELSGGSIQIDLQAGGVLGSEGDVLDSIVGGTGAVDMGRFSVSSLTGYGVPKNSLLALPYLFGDRDHFWNFAESNITEEMSAEIDEVLSMKALMYGEEGFRHFFASKPLTSLDDFKGLKIRTSTDPLMSNTVNALGANATVIAYSELYSSLQTGVVDGAENPMNNYKTNAFDEVAKNVILDGHQLGVVTILITDAAWEKLTPAQQECVTKAAEETRAYNKELSANAESDVLKVLEDEGVTVTPVEDKTPWKEAVQSVVNEYTKGYEDLYQSILDCAK